MTQRRKAQIFTAIVIATFWGIAIHPAFLALFGVGVWGMNKYGEK